MFHTPLNSLKRFILKTFLLFLVACGTGAQTSDITEKTDTLSSTAKLDSALEEATPIEEYVVPVEESEPAPEPVALDEAQLVDSLHKYFDAEWIEIFEKSKEKYGRIVSIYDFRTYYQSLSDSMIYKLEKSLNRDIGWIPEAEFVEMKLNWWNNYFPMIGFQMVCTDEEGIGMVCTNKPVLNLTALLQKAKSTNGKEDDEFIKMLGLLTSSEPDDINHEQAPLYYNEYDDYGWLINVGCDWCTVSKVGDGHRSSRLQNMEGAAIARELFFKEIQRLLGMALDVKYDHYYYSKEKVLQEVDQMLTIAKRTRLLVAEELAELQSNRDAIKAMDYKSFKCGEGANCDFGPSPFEH